jgi:pimeloyl-ACP methyl ester carboxylesterase
MKQARLHLLRIIIATLMLTLPTTLRAQEAKTATPETHTLKSTIPLIVIGFAGGFIKRTSTVHGEVALANHLREKYGHSIHAEIFENHNSQEAHQKILQLLAASSQPARIILYGHSWGASEAVNEARRLQRDNIPVLLLIAVDGVPKRSQDDSIIPANVAQAINFYQTEGLLHGRPAISAADPAATQIIDNIHLTYKDNEVPTPGYPWFARTFTKRHIEIENDPRVWNQVEAMILANLPLPTLAASTTTP